MTRWPAYSFSANARASVLFPVRRAPSSRSARLPRETLLPGQELLVRLAPEHAATSPFRLRPHETGTLYRLDSTRNGRCGSHFPYTKREVRKRLSIHETGGSARSAQAPGPARPSPRKWGAAYRAAPAGGPVPLDPPLQNWRLSVPHGRRTTYDSLRQQTFEEGGRRHQRLAGRRALARHRPRGREAESVDMLEVPSTPGTAWSSPEHLGRQVRQLSGRNRRRVHADLRRRRVR